MSSWQSKLEIRRGLLGRAQRSVAYWARRAGSAHGRQMLEEATARRELRRHQVAEAERQAGIAGISDAGLALIAASEGFRSHPYPDPATGGAPWTIGYGETKGVTRGSPPISRAQALAKLRLRISRDFLPPVLKAAARANLTLRQHEADALVSLVYNLGPGVLEPGHTIGDAIAARDRRRIADAFLVYDKAGRPPRRMLGLTRRRRAERALFLKA